MRTGSTLAQAREGAGAAAKVRADGPVVPPAHALQRPRDPARGRAGAHLRGPRDGRAARRGRQDAAARPVEVPARVVDREPALLQLVRPARPARPQRLPGLRSPHDRAPALILPVPRLSSAVLLPMLALALALPGCGSDSSAVQEVPGAPAGLTVPHQKGAGDLSEGAAGATPTPTPSA